MSSDCLFGKGFLPWHPSLCVYMYLWILYDVWVSYQFLFTYNMSWFYRIFNLFTAASIRVQFHHVTANTSITIRCDVFGGDRVVWRKNDKKLKLDDQQRYAGGNVNEPSLVIRKLNRLDRGNYTCETTFKSVTAKSTTIELYVRGRYKI